MEQFCPRCGDATDELLGPRGLCHDCFVETTDFVEIPDEIRFTQCSECGRYRKDNTWTEFESDQQLVFDVLSKYEKEDVEMSAAFKRQGATYEVTVFMEKTVDGSPVQMKEETVLVPEETTCTTCGRFHGGYFEAIIQLRDNVSEDLFGWLMEKAGHETSNDRKNFISNVEQRHGGYDIYVSTTTMAEKLVRWLRERGSIESERSKELVGEQEGQKVYRSVYIVRVK